jgi:PTS system mannose-specific IIB component
LERSKNDEFHICVFKNIFWNVPKKEELMKKFVIASHAKMAEGIQSTLELFVGRELDVTYMCAYVEGELEIEKQIEVFFADLKEEDQAVIFTDDSGSTRKRKCLHCSRI